MLQYVQNIIIPYVQCTRGSFDDDKPALVIIQLQGTGNRCSDKSVEVQNVCLLPPNTRDLLQPTDISVNNPAKDFLNWCFEDWYPQ